MRFGLHAVDQVGELHRILDEEDRDVVADQIIDALIGVELHGEAAHVTRQVGAAPRTGHCAEAHENRRAARRIVEKTGLGPLGQWLIDLEVTMRTGPTRVHHPLGYPLMIEVHDLIPQDMVFQQRGTTQPGFQAILVVVDRKTLIRR